MYLVKKLHYHQQSKVLDVFFDNEQNFSLSAEYLRTHSPSAEVQGHGNHGKDPKQLVLNKQHVAIKELVPVGHYAVRLIFDDGHDSGLFSWQYLYSLASEQTARWQKYQDRVTEFHTNKDRVPIKFMP